MNNYNTNSKPIVLAMLVGLLIAAGTGCTSTGTKSESSTNVTVSPTVSSTINPSPDSTEPSLEASVSDAIIAYNKGKEMGADNQEFATEYHDTIKTVEQGDTSIVYVVALYAQYKYTNNAPVLTTASCGPVALTFMKNSSGVYNMTEYWEAPDNSTAKSIQVKFPADAAEKAYQIMGSNSNGMNICNQKAKEHFAS